MSNDEIIRRTDALEALYEQAVFYFTIPTHLMG